MDANNIDGAVVATSMSLLFVAPIDNGERTPSSEGSGPGTPGLRCPIGQSGTAPLLTGSTPPRGAATPAASPRAAPATLPHPPHPHHHRFIYLRFSALIFY
eukprot:1193820-Prorocentrum_minimum.AAC.2